MHGSVIGTRCGTRRTTKKKQVIQEPDGLGLRENCAQSGTQKRPPRDLSLFLTERASDARVFYNAFSERVSSLATLFPSTSRAQMYARFGRAHRTEHHLTKKREKTRILTTTTAKQILPRPPKRDSNRAPRWRPSYFAPSLSREKKQQRRTIFSLLLRVQTTTDFTAAQFCGERERDFNKRRTKRPEKFKDSNLFSNTLNSRKEKNWSSILSSLIFFSEKARRSFAEV